MSTITNTAVNVTPDTPVFMGCSKPLESDVQFSYFLMVVLSIRIIIQLGIALVLQSSMSQPLR